MTERKKILVVFHGDCTDGWTAAWAAWKKFGDSAEYVPATYRPTDVFDVDEREVYILDYCPTRIELQGYARRAAPLLVIDHHQSAEERCVGLDYCLFDMKRSGAGMAWDYFHPGVKRPLIVDYVEDRDIWRWALADSKIVSSALFSYSMDSFENWSELALRVENNLPEILLEGKAVNRAESIAITGVKRNVRLMAFAGHQDVPVVNTTGTNISEVLNQLSAPGYFAASWFQRANGTFKYSLRSKGDFDVAKLAERFGGGGHKNASAFVSDLPPWELEHVPARATGKC